MQNATRTSFGRQSDPIRARLTMIDFEAEYHKKSPVLLAGVLSATDDELYVAIPGLFWPGTRFRVDYPGDEGPVTTYATVQRIDPESPDGTERLGHAMRIIPDPTGATESTKAILQAPRRMK
jgi:hypothetical protein